MENKYMISCPKHWDKNSYDFLVKIVSVTGVPLDNTTFWLKGASKFITPAQETSEQSLESKKFYLWLADQLLSNGSLTGNLQVAIFHCLIQMRYMKTIDYSTDVSDELCGLSLAISILLKDSFIVARSNQLKQLFKGKDLPNQSIRNLSVKFESNEDSQVYIHALQQAAGDSCNFFVQYLQYLILGVCKIDISKSFKSQCFVHYSMNMFLDIFQTQLRTPNPVQSTNIPHNYILSALYNEIGPSHKFNSNANIADLLVTKLLLMIVNPQEFVPSYGSLMYSTYTYWMYGEKIALNFNASSLKSKSFLLLMLLVSQPLPQNTGINALLISSGESDALSDTVNSFFNAFRRVNNKKSASRDSSVPFPKLFDIFTNNLKLDEYIFIFYLLVTTNKYFREYCIARSDSETLLLKILKVLSRDFSEALTASANTDKVSNTESHPITSDRKSSLPASVLMHELQTRTSSSRSFFVSPTNPEPQIDNSFKKDADLEFMFTKEKPNIEILKSKCIPPRLYSLLGVLLKLTKDNLFISSMAKLNVSYSPWMHPSCLEKHQQAVSLPCLVVAEILQIFSKNFSLYKDPTIHAYLLLCLHNVFPCVFGISSSLASRFIKIYEMITKQYLKLVSQINKSFEFGPINNVYTIEMSKRQSSTGSNTSKEKRGGTKPTSIEPKPEDLIQSDEILALLRKSPQICNLSEFLVYSDTHYIFSLALLETLYKTPEKNVQLVYELVRSKSVLLNFLNPNLLCYINQSFLVSDNDQATTSFALQVNNVISCLYELVDYIVNSINSNQSNLSSIDSSATGSLKGSQPITHSLSASPSSALPCLTPKETFSLIKLHCITWSKRERDPKLENQYEEIDYFEFREAETYDSQFFETLNSWAWYITHKNDMLPNLNQDSDSENFSSLLHFVQMYQ